MGSIIRAMTRAKGHACLLSVLAFCLLAFVAELSGRALTASVDIGRHFRSPGDATDYYPFLLAGVKVCIALARTPGLAGGEGPRHGRRRPEGAGNLGPARVCAPRPRLRLAAAVAFRPSRSRP